VETADVVIAGAGIVGLSLALDLASRGLKIIVLDRGPAMAESSWAAAGMLAALDPENPPALTQLARFSLTRYPAYLTHIEQLSGRKVPLRFEPTLQAIAPGTPTDELHDARQLTSAELHALAPGLLSQNRTFIELDEQSLDPRDLCAALPLAAIAAGVHLREHSPVISIDAQNAHIKDAGNARVKDAEDAGVTIHTAAAPIAAAHFVNCAGAWAESPAFGRLPLGHPRVAPAKGQIALVRLRGPESLNVVLRTPDIYLVPRGEGWIVIGATVEQAGYDKTIHPHAIAALLKAAAELWPPIAFAELVDSWAGLRPASSDELPLIGSAAQPNCWIAAGHFRNGILLAPGTARALARLICGENPEVDLAPFDPARTSPVSAQGISRPLDRRVPA
jgi:glycine oxidase